ncbi:hypothetical protein FRAHR75_110045 [Frankia sp. Hr75.2]|nr:hypothetical protein FRAHR75_110045 [Frankia sp. Hr75.2]
MGRAPGADGLAGTGVVRGLAVTGLAVAGTVVGAKAGGGRCGIGPPGGRVRGVRCRL